MPDALAAPHTLHLLANRQPAAVQLSAVTRRAGCLCRQTAGSWNVLDTLAFVIICHHLSSFVIIGQQPATRTFHDVLMNQSVSTEDNRGLTSYITPPLWFLWGGVVS
jgi:hypothetical protein